MPLLANRSDSAKAPPGRQAVFTPPLGARNLSSGKEVYRYPEKTQGI